MAKKTPKPSSNLKDYPGIYATNAETAKTIDDFRRLGKDLVASYAIESLIGPAEAAAIEILRKYRTRKPNGKYQTADTYPHRLPKNVPLVATIAARIMLDIRAMRIAIDAGQAHTAAGLAFRIGVSAERLGVLESGFEDDVRRIRKSESDLDKARSGKRLGQSVIDATVRVYRQNRKARTTPNAAIDDTAADLGVSKQTVRHHLERAEIPTTLKNERRAL